MIKEILEKQDQNGDFVGEVSLEVSKKSGASIYIEKYYFENPKDAKLAMKYMEKAKNVRAKIIG